MLFWDVTPCGHNIEESIFKRLWCDSPHLLNDRLVNNFFIIYQRLGGTCCLYLRDRIVDIISANTAWEPVYDRTLHKGSRITCTNPTQS
jgi:hypothetical protein